MSRYSEQLCQIRRKRELIYIQTWSQLQLQLRLISSARYIAIAASIILFRFICNKIAKIHTNFLITNAVFESIKSYMQTDKFLNAFNLREFL